MIRKQYRRGQPCYFNNFVNEHDSQDIYDLASYKEVLEARLKPYNATLGKNKYRNNYAINVKWHDEKLYAMFMLKWS